MRQDASNITRRPRLRRVAARLLVGLAISAVLLVSWRLHSLAAVQLGKAALGGRGAVPMTHENHLHEIHLVPAVTPNNSIKQHSAHHPIRANALPISGEQFEAVLLRTVQNILFEDDSLWPHADSLHQHHFRLGVACDFGNKTRNGACAAYFSQAFRKHKAFAAVPLAPRVLTATAREARRGGVSGATWLDAPSDIALQLPTHAAKMKSNIVERLRTTKQLPLNVTEVVRAASFAHAATMASAVRCLRSTEPLDRMVRRAATTAAIGGGPLPSARLISARQLIKGEVAPAVVLRTAFRSASVVVIALDEDAGSLKDGPSPLLDAVAAEFEAPAVAAACSFASAHDLDDLLEGPVAVFVRCNDTAEASEVCEVDDDVASEGRTVSSSGDRQLAPICSLSTDVLRLRTALKWGTKTAIFKGTLGNRSVAVKMFHIDQYATFRGFFSMVAPLTRSPYINYPTSSCLDPETEAIYQVQPFLGRGKNLLQFIKAEGKKLQWPLRLELVAQLLCVFQHLHEHPAGFVTFDDNHPEQYYVTETHDASGRRHLRLTMVDIDTLQLGEASTAGGTPRDPTQFRIQCRCFYCHGRSNCLFMNTLRGYRACGQGPEDATHGDKEDLMKVMPGKHCDGHSDTWFIAQLLYLVGKGSVAWAQVAHVEVLSRLEAGTVPTLHLPDAPAYAKLVDDLFHQRITIGGTLQVIDDLCKAQDGCQRETSESGSMCHPPVTDHVRPYTSPLLL